MTYESMANQKGWPAGKLFRQGWFLIVGGLSVIGSTWASFSFFSWFGLFILPISWIISALLTFGMRKNVQYVSLLLIFSFVGVKSALGSYVDFE